VSKVILEKKQGQLVVVNRLEYPEAINERMLHAIDAGELEGVLPIAVSVKKKETRLECYVQGMIPLKQYLRGNLSKVAFLRIVYQIASLIKKCERNLISPKDLELHIDRLYVEAKTGEIKCIYWPIVNNQRSFLPQTFFKTFPSELRFSTAEDRTYLQEYKAFFNETTLFSLNNFIKMLRKLSGEEMVAEIAPEESVSIKDREKKTPVNIAYDPLDTQKQNLSTAAEQKENVCADCGEQNKPGAKFCRSCGAKLPYEDDLGQKLTEDVAGDETATVYCVDSQVKRVTPLLTRVSTGETFLLDKEKCRIGKDKSCHVCVLGNQYISRNHAEIICCGEQWLIEDCNSTNKTFVNGVQVLPGQRNALFPGAKIQLADEMFILDMSNLS